MSVKLQPRSLTCLAEPVLPVAVCEFCRCLVIMQPELILIAQKWFCKIRQWDRGTLL